MLGILKKFSKRDPIVGVDIGSHSIKLVELDMNGSVPRLVNISYTPLSGEMFLNNAIKETEKVAQQLSVIFESNAIEAHQVALAVPGPSVFIKKIQTPKLEPKELSESIGYEAGSYIPHPLDAVKLDYHVLGEANKTQLNLILVAVKNEIIDSFTESFALAGLEPMVVDVDYFALQNAFELCYPELIEETVALVNIGERYTAIQICRGGQGIFSGDIALGGKSVTETIAQELGVSLKEAEKIKGLKNEGHELYGRAQELLDQSCIIMASEIHRQLSFFWSTLGEEGGLDKIFLCGGGSVIPRLADELSTQAGIVCEVMDPFRGIEISSNIDANIIKEISPCMGVAVGLAIRYPGDKIVGDFA